MGVLIIWIGRLVLLLINLLAERYKPCSRCFSGIIGVDWVSWILESLLCDKKLGLGLRGSLLRLGALGLDWVNAGFFYICLEREETNMIKFKWSSLVFLEKMDLVMNGKAIDRQYGVVVLVLCGCIEWDKSDALFCLSSIIVFFHLPVNGVVGGSMDKSIVPLTHCVIFFVPLSHLVIDSVPSASLCRCRRPNRSVESLRHNGSCLSTNHLRCLSLSCIWGNPHTRCANNILRLLSYIQIRRSQIYTRQIQPASTRNTHNAYSHHKIRKEGTPSHL